MAVVIADAGPLIALAKIGQLDSLAALFSAVVVTQAVADECLRSPSNDASLIKQAIEKGWLLCVENPVIQKPLSMSLGAGEQSSIAYAMQSAARCLLIMDDTLARKLALRNALNIVGTAALLFAAQRKGMVSDAEGVCAQLKQVGYRISPAVIAQLRAAE